VIAPSTSCRLGIVIAGAPAGFGVLNARILRLPRLVVKDYACPFVLFGSRSLSGGFKVILGRESIIDIGIIGSL
jgi:hypothetical protein